MISKRERLLDMARRSHAPDRTLPEATPRFKRLDDRPVDGLCPVAVPINATVRGSAKSYNIIDSSVAGSRLATPLHRLEKIHFCRW